MKYILVILSALFAIHADAEDRQLPKGTQFMVSHGDKKTYFNLELVHNPHFTKMVGGKTSAKITIKKKDVEFLNKKLKQIVAMSSNQIVHCQRQYMMLVQDGRTVLGCVGSRTDTAEALTSFANILTAYSR